VARPRGLGRVDRVKLATVVCCLLVPEGCAPAQSPLACADAGSKPMQEYMLFFGRSIPGRAPLSDIEWSTFLEHTVTPLLPSGFTVLDAEGQWQSPATHRIVSESTKVIIAAVPASDNARSAIQSIRDAYRAQFRQQSVGLIVYPVCAAF
jgi:hypothetical protein